MNNSIVKFSVHNSISKVIITSDESVKNTKTYRDVSNVIFRLVESGLSYAGSGYCISMSDIIYSLLVQNKIPCKLVECQLTAFNKLTNDTTLIGFEGFRGSEDQVDTHVVVMTTTEPVLLIDMSIQHILTEGFCCVIDGTLDGKDRIIANIETDDMILTYQEKKKNTIPLLHQRSIVDRINTDINIYKNFRVLRMIVIIALVVSTLNAVRGIYEYYKVFVDDTNFWGPNTISLIIDKLDGIEKKLNQ